MLVIEMKDEVYFATDKIYEWTRVIKPKLDFTESSTLVKVYKSYQAYSTECPFLTLMIIWNYLKMKSCIRFPTSWFVARDLGYSLKAIESVTNVNENIKAGALVERLMCLHECAMNHHLDRSGIEDFFHAAM